MAGLLANLFPAPSPLFTIVQSPSSQPAIPGPLCVSIGARDLTAVRRLMAANVAYADIFEIRLDCLSDPRPAELLAGVPRPLLVTCRPAWEGGGWQGGEEERLALLLEAAAAGAAIVDLELRAGADLRHRLREACRRHGCRLLLSWHDFEKTPPTAELRRIVSDMAAAGADIAKVVTTAGDRVDVLAVLDLYREPAAVPLTAFAMGRVGAVTRLAAPLLGAPLTYAAPEGGGATAPGQLAAATLARMLSEFGHDH